MSAEGKLVADLAELDGRVQAAIAAIEAGRVIDVTALDAEIRELCAAAAGAARGERDAVKSGLAALEQNLARLAAAIRSRMPAMDDGRPTAPPGRAAAAYGKPPQGEI